MAKSIVMQISIVTLILLLSDQILGEAKSLREGANCLRGRPLPPPPPWNVIGLVDLFYVVNSVYSMT